MERVFTDSTTVNIPIVANSLILKNHNIVVYPDDYHHQWYNEKKLEMHVNQNIQI